MALWFGIALDITSSINFPGTGWPTVFYLVAYDAIQSGYYTPIKVPFP